MVIDGDTPSRKAEHIRICLNEHVTNGIKPGFEQVMLIHQALPELNYKDIDTSCTFLGKKLRAPILISGMTGGCKEAKRINKNLAQAAENCGVGFGLGSQRAMIENPELADTYYVRDVAPNTLLVGNIGLVQFALGYGKEQIEAACSIGIDVLALHLNPLQEVCQPEGDKEWKGCLDALRDVCKLSRVPVMVKETGAGISAENAQLAEQCGAAAIDISGCGGTNFALVESYRKGWAGKTFHDWGIPTVCSLMEVRKAVKVPLVCSGGVKTGVDIAKAIALGADMAGIARPLLKPATESAEAVEKKIEQIIAELKAAMLLSGAKNIEEMRRVKYVLTGMVKDWADQRLNGNGYR